MTGINVCFSFVTLDINGLNSTIQRKRLADGVAKQDPLFF